MNEEKKLKRGLKDISEFFGRSEAPALRERMLPRQVKAVSIFSPDDPEDSLFLSSYLASRLAATEASCSVVSIRCEGYSQEEALKQSTTGFKGAVAHQALSQTEFERICSEPLQPNTENEPYRQILFLDTDYRVPGAFLKVLPLVDKWIFFLKPEIESLMSAYRYIKGTHGVNPDLQYLLIFDGGLNNALNSILFERFAALLSERLGIHLVWLGSMQMEHGQRSWASSLELEHLFLEEIKKTDTPAKLALAEYIKNQSLKNLEVHV